ncbi:MAG TPA: FAD-dependent oxidoreductase, partial [Acidimicrobiales bacterium]|nr:FAD-dependent oxidoreductase [Acidimicrobiales bacterium]
MTSVVVGAGLSGLVAAGRLRAAGRDVVVLDKGAEVGGRLATRRLAGGVLDEGAQFFTVRSEAFAALVDPWRRTGLVYEWAHGFQDPPDGYPRYAVRGGMASLAAALAADLDVRPDTFVFAIRPADGGWEVVIDDGTILAADAVLVSCPVPQSASLLITSGLAIPDELRRTDYDRTIALLAVLDRPGAVPEPGGVQQADATFSFVADNQRKGVSNVPALTLHAASDVSRSHWDDPPAALEEWLLAAADPWLGGAVVTACHVKRWRFATPQRIWPEACWASYDGPAPAVMAGDAFAGPKVEGAALSGLAAA